VSSTLARPMTSSRMCGSDPRSADGFTTAPAGGPPDGAVREGRHTSNVPTEKPILLRAIMWSADRMNQRGRTLSLPRRGAPGICQVSSALLTLFRGERSAERRRGLRDPLGPLRAALHTPAKRMRVPLRSGTLAFRRSTTAFSWDLVPHTSSGACQSGQLVDRQLSRAPCARVIVPVRPGPEAPRVSGRVSRTRGSRPCFWPCEHLRKAPLTQAG
jgi:hypothetical protein